MTQVTQLSFEEQEQYRGIRRDLKAKVLEMYLLGKDGRYYNMEEVARECMSNIQDSWTVSMIHRANGINCGKGNTKKGLYGPNCRFEQIHHYRVTRADIEAFLREFEPMGSAYQGVAFEDWLVMRAQAANRLGRINDEDMLSEEYAIPLDASQRHYGTNRTQNYGAQNYGTQNYGAQDYGTQDHDTGANGDFRWGNVDLRPVGVMAVLVIALLIIFRKPIWAFIIGLLKIALGIAVLAGILYILYKVISKK